MNNNSFEHIEDINEQKKELLSVPSEASEQDYDNNPSYVYDKQEHTLIAKAPSVDEVDPDLMRRLAVKYREAKDKITAGAQEKEGVVTVDIDQMDPSLAAEELQKKYEILQERAAIASYLKRTEFNEIHFKQTPLEIDDPEQKRIKMNAIIKELSRNGELSKDKSFIKKLYKLKDNETLVEESIEREEIEKELTDITIKTWELIFNYKKKLNIYLEGIQLKRESGEDLSEKEKLNELAIKLTHAESGYNSLKEQILQIEDFIKYIAEQEKIELEEGSGLLESAKILLEEFKNQTNQIKKECEEQIEEIKQSTKSSGESTLQSNNDYEIKIETLTQRCEKLKQELEATDETNAKLEKAVSKYEEEIAEKTKLIDSLKEELDKTIEERQKIQTPPPSPRVNEVVVNSEQEENQEEEKKKGGSFIKIILGIFVSLLFIIIAGGAYGYFTMQDEQAQTPPPNYSKPLPLPVPTKPQPPADMPKQEEQTQTALNEPTPLSTIDKEEQPLQSKQEAPIEKAAQIDYLTNFSEEKFMQQNFKIVDKNTIIYNEKEVKINEVVNGYRFIKSTSTGNILFVTPKNEPLWAEETK